MVNSMYVACVSYTLGIPSFVSFQIDRAHPLPIGIITDGIGKKIY